MATSINKDLLECPVCTSEMRPPKRIFQCIAGHSLCEECKSKVRICPTCRVEMKIGNVSRNLLAEAIAEKAFSSENVDVVFHHAPLSNIPDGLDDDVSFMLDALKLEDLKPIFADEQLDIEGIVKLSSENLREIGILNEKDRLAILEEAENIILTRECFQNVHKTISHKACNKGHQLFLVPSEKLFAGSGHWICNNCRDKASAFKNRNVRVWRCLDDRRMTDGGKCDFDLCDDCKNKADPQNIRIIIFWMSVLASGE